MFTGKYLVLNGAQDLLGVVDDQNIQVSLLPIHYVWPFPDHLCRRPIPGVIHSLHSGLKKKECEETVAKAVAAPWVQQPGQHIGVEFLRTPESIAASKLLFADKVECIELVALFCCKFPDSLQTLIRRELVEGLLLFLLFFRQHVRQMCQPGGDAVKSGNLCSIRISQDVCDMFKSRDGTCQQRHLLRFVLCMHWRHIRAQGT